MNTSKIIVMICFSIILTACGHMSLYEGDQQSPENVVIINGLCKGPLPWDHNWVRIKKFDGEIIITCHLSYEFLPGNHVLTLLSSNYYKTTVTKEFKAGERYKLKINDPYFPNLIYIGKYNKITGSVEP